MASKSSLQKLQDAVVGTVKGVVKDPVGTAGRAVQTAKGTFALGKMVAGQVTRSAAARAKGARTEPAPKLTTPPPAAAPERDVVITPSDVARVVEKKSPAEKAAAKKAPAKKAPARKVVSSPSGKLPPRKAPPRKAPAKAPAKKSPGERPA